MIALNEINGRRNKGVFAAKYAAKIGILTALATVLMLFEFPLAFVAPPFYEIDLSDTVILIGGFALGPLAAVIIELLKVLLNLLINGTMTGGVGELGNFLIGCSLTVPAAFIYKYKKTRGGAAIGLLVGTVSIAVLGAAINYLLLVPAYAKVNCNGDMSIIIGMGSKIFPWVKDLFTFVLSCTLPFNLIKGAISSIICYILYKRVSPILHI